MQDPSSSLLFVFIQHVFLFVWVVWQKKKKTEYLWLKKSNTKTMELCETRRKTSTMWFEDSKGSFFWICSESSLVIQVLPFAESTNAVRIIPARHFSKPYGMPVQSQEIIRLDSSIFNFLPKHLSIVVTWLCSSCSIYLIWTGPGLDRVSLSDCKAFWGSKLPPDFSRANEPGKYESNVRLGGWVHESMAAQHTLFSTIICYANEQ